MEEENLRLQHANDLFLKSTQVKTQVNSKATYVHMATSLMAEGEL